ncbi:ROK family protein [Denitromonas ohlonensis]|uniref:ROK family protein n=2 Tax=Denitromonas TaxID=139331 RepID=A0A557RQG9_9RHOO|nr:ROK family protein [Denitromonas ohlonensis]TVO67417.1 ROK family protein [Denitromonas ohlonensis]TVO72036.1 ROK family protein [Denitromonas ohlonensis]
MLRIGVDLGGTKIEAIALDGAGRALVRERIATPQNDYMATVMTVAGLVERMEQSLGERAHVGVGTPGAISTLTGCIKNANSTCLNGQPLLRDLQTVLRRKIRLANDANCFAVSEATDGAARGARTVFGVILGTGVGGGLVIDGRVLGGANAIAGEWGHNPLADEDAAPPCYCGRSGCVETWLSGPGMAADHRRHGGEAIDAASISARAEAGDVACEASFLRYADRLSRALASVINIVDPEVIVLGGGLSSMARLYTEVPARWGRHVFSDAVSTRLLPPMHGDSSGVRGAAWLWPLEDGE